MIIDTESEVVKIRIITGNIRHFSGSHTDENIVVLTPIYHTVVTIEYVKYIEYIG